jgi:hypothetical protein
MVRTGSSGYLQYGKEATFAGGATQTRVFGLEQKITGITWKNNQIPLTALNDLEVQCFAYGKNEGNASVEFVLSTPWIFDLLLDAVDTTGSASDFTHIWSSDKTALTADNSGIVIPHTFHMEHGLDAETNNVVRNMKGCVLQNLTIKASLGETIKCTTDMIWGNEDAVSTTLDTTIAADDIKFPYTFSHATLELPDGSVVAQLQEFEITFIATLQITFTNNLATTNEKSIVLDFTGVGVSDHQTEMSPGEPVFETLSWQLRSVQVTANNSISTSP